MAHVPKTALQDALIQKARDLAVKHATDDIRRGDVIGNPTALTAYAQEQVARLVVTPMALDANAQLVRAYVATYGTKVENWASGPSDLDLSGPAAKRTVPRRRQ